MKSEKRNKIIYWLLTGLVALVFLVRGTTKSIRHTNSITPIAVFVAGSSPNLLAASRASSFANSFPDALPGVIGTLLLAAYMGGAIATHLEHGISVIAPCIVLTVMLLVAFYRFPELRNRLLPQNP